MSWTYVLTTDVGKVRLTTGANVAADEVFSDEEIGIFLTAGGSVALASAYLLDAWAAKYLLNADTEKIGDYSYAQSIAKNFRAQAERLRKVDSAKPYMTWSEWDLTGEDE